MRGVNNMPRLENGKRLTRTVVGNLPVTGKRYFMYCNDPKQFGVHVTAGGHKSYIYYYSDKLGKVYRPIIAEVGEITVDEARKIACEKLLYVAQGGNPVIDEQNGILAKKDEKTVADTWEKFLDYCEIKIKANRLKPSTFKSYKALYKLHIKPYMGAWPIKSLNRQNLQEEFDRLTKNSIYNANHWQRLVSNILNRCEEWGWRDIRTNPCYLIQLNKENKRTRMLTTNEKAGIAAKLRDLRLLQGEDRYALAYIECLCYTGCRKTEWLTLKWENVHLDDACVWLPNTKGGEALKGLAPQVVTILRSLPKVPGNPYVFASPVTMKHFVGVQKVWERIRNQISGCSDVCFHMFRHNAATTGVGLKLGTKNIGGFLDHKDLKSTERYMHNNIEEKKETAAIIGAKLAEDFNPDNYVPPSEKVVQIGARRNVNR